MKSLKNVQKMSVFEAFYYFLAVFLLIFGIFTYFLENLIFA